MERRSATQSKIKRTGYNALQLCKNQEDWKNILVKKETKQTISEAKSKAFKDFYKRLHMKEGDRDAYKIVRARERKTNDLTQSKCIKDEDSNILVEKKQ